MLRSFAYLLLTAYMGARWGRGKRDWPLVWTCVAVAGIVSVIAFFI